MVQADVHVSRCQFPGSGWFNVTLRQWHFEHIFAGHEADQDQWCRDYLRQGFANTYIVSSEIMVWHFENRKEAIWFALTWA